MKARIPFTFDSLETLSPKKLMSNFQRMAKDVTDMQAQRYVYSSFVLPYDLISSAQSAISRTFRIRAPRSYTIVGVEIQYYQAAGVTLTLTSTATGFNTVTLASVALATRAYTYKVQNCNVAALTETDFVVGVTAGTVGACKVIVHIRSSRFASAPVEYKPSQVISISSGEDLSASNLDAEFVEVQNAVVDDTANQSDLRIQVLSRRSVVSPFPSDDDRIRLFSSKRTLHSADVYVVAAATNDAVITIIDESAGTVGTATATASGTGSLARTTVSIADTQTKDDPDDSADDYKLIFSRSGAGAATIGLMYSVIYYT